LLNYLLPTLKLQHKEQAGCRGVRKCGPAVTPLSRVLACAAVSGKTKARVESQKQSLNPCALRREVDRQIQAIEAHRRVPGA